MRPIWKVYVGRVYQPQVNLVNDFTGAEGVVARTARQTSVRQLAQPIVHQWNELIPGV